MTDMTTVRFYGHDCTVHVTRYTQPPNVAIQLRCEDGAPMATASFNPDFLLPEGTVAIKTWSENAGIDALLLEAGIIGPFLGAIPAGYSAGSLHHLLIKENDDD